MIVRKGAEQKVFLGTLLVPLGWVVLEMFVTRSVRLRIADANAGG